MAGRDSMRAGDTDRQVVAERLRTALDEGRLDLHEYDERLQRVYAARTYGELDEVTTDLPGPAPAERSTLSPVQPVDQAPVPVGGGGPMEPVGTGRWLLRVWGNYLRVVTIVLAIWAVSSLVAGDLLYFWPVWVAGPWGAVLLVQTVTGLAAGRRYGGSGHGG